MLLDCRLPAVGKLAGLLPPPLQAGPHHGRCRRTHQQQRPGGGGDTGRFAAGSSIGSEFIGVGRIRRGGRLGLANLKNGKLGQSVDSTCGELAVQPAAASGVNEPAHR